MTLAKRKAEKDALSVGARLLKRRLCEKWGGHRFESGVCTRCGRWEGENGFLQDHLEFDKARMLRMMEFNWFGGRKPDPRVDAVLARWPGYAKVLDDRIRARVAARKRVQEVCDECGQKIRHRR